ncbi:helix-turn-helix domain-containing protein [Agrilactobacillus yilanensis]|uniref:Helix-turn-helix domain-containing protein n=1 Tax=Agrilactobacillus yilanensis TaxID=2485997 RepID=A0ABW4J5U7_9LACO|nr:helix-turn-helix transcriptional regulator [Agrilactobacillus yilanensis]
MASIGVRIKERRKAIGLSADTLADKLGLNRATIFRYESGAVKDIPVSILKELALSLQTTPAYLMGWETQKNANSELIAAHIDKNATPEEIEDIIQYIEFRKRKVKD